MLNFFTIIDQCSLEVILTKYEDYLNMVCILNDPVHLKPYFKDINELTTMHDNTAVAINMIKNKTKTKKFKQHIAKWKKWIYDEEKKFVVISPNSPKDLAVEGNELHHCVKSYIDRVADGQTNIMFIRKKDELDKPFFTVEITNDGSIQQVHGFANRNASTEPGLTEFVKRWAKERKLKLTNFNKVR